MSHSSLSLWSFLLLSLCAVSCTSRAGQSVTPAVVQSRPVESAAAAARASAPADSILRRTVYTTADSARVVALLAERIGKGENDVLHYARQFKGVPYVASTLEGYDPERLVVKLDGLDCTTLVETSLALALTRREGGKTFADYCRNLMRLRYRGGKMNGYLSRLHYFTWWMHDNLDKGLIEPVEDSRHFTATIKVDNHYMSAHPEKYAHLKGHPERVDSIRRMERRTNGPDGHYLPAALMGLSRKELSVIHDGDLIAIVTRKDGIDYSHLGFAVWGHDGLLHLLNASSIHHKVVEEPKTLRQYLREHPSSIGIRVMRLKIH